MDEFSIKVLLLGDEEVGKSTFLSRISQGGHSLDGHSTAPIQLLRDIDQPFIFELRNTKCAYRLELYDTASPENWRLLEPDVILICYDISRKPSLDNVQKVWIQEVRGSFRRSDHVPIVVVGLKRDLRSEDDPNCVINPQAGYVVAQEIRADKYVECSAVTGELLKLAFEEICSTARRTTSASGGQSEGGCAVM